MKKAILIPVYNHGKACMGVVKSIEPYCRENDVQIILVDDGNGEETKSCLSELVRTYGPLVDVVVNEKNCGKGVAFRKGIFRAQELGTTHVLQLDADGQHDASRCQFFFERAEQNQGAMICGYPEYDETAPEHRKNAHKFANMWCEIVTWQRGIVDSLCGFRIYPVDETCRFLKHGHIDSRMGFDIDILIKLIWRGVPFEFYPVRVTYPSDGVSNFRAFRDNVRISWVFTKFCCGMIIRSPMLLWRKIRGR
ncbi:MAG: glycosyltransferase family 2 protein [Treponema sp.]|nr:glycosyltransferase family 2 protein [Treponema sp.]